jgi:transposase InsO family protein
LEWFLFLRCKAKGNVSFTCRHFGISRKTLYLWQKRFKEVDLFSLEERSRAPKRRRAWRVTAEEEVRILQLRKENLRWGKMKIALLYQKTYGEKISSWKVQRVIERHSLYFHPEREAKARRKKKRTLQKKRTELKASAQTGFLVHLDTLKIPWSGSYRYIFTAIDYHTRIAYARMYKSANSRNASDFLQRLLYLLSVPIQHVHTGNGSEFSKYFSQLCQSLHIPQYLSRVKMPKDNPRLERFNRTLREEWLDFGEMGDDLEEINASLREWLSYYNAVRPHQSLGYLTPLEFAEEYTQVLPMYSSNTTS